MKIELRNFKMVTRMSEETTCFTASVYIDGKREGEASNDGRGGCHRYHPRSLEDMLNAHAKTLPPEPNPYHPGTFMPFEADDLINDAMNALLEQQNFDRMTKTKTACRLPGKAYKFGEWSIFARLFTPELKAQIVAKYGAGTVFLNEDKALMNT